MMEFSPPKPLPRQPRSERFTVNAALSPEENEERAVLVLKPFCAAPRISFKKVKIGCTKIVNLYILNPLDVSQCVRVEKFPEEKGFFIENDEISLGPNEETVFPILWAPEKASNYRETIVFKSSTGCKTCVYLLGTAYSSFKKIPKVIPTKRKKLHSKKSLKESKCEKSSVYIKSFSENAKIFEEKKENINFLNSKCIPFTNLSGDSNFKCPSTFEPRASFMLKTCEEFPDSPIRRQTYTINTMLLNSRESEILPVPLDKSIGNVKVENARRKKSAVVAADANNCSNKNFPMENAIFITSHEDKLNDSLEIREICREDLNDSLSETELKDEVKVLDRKGKHLYFGFTPQHPRKNEGNIDFTDCFKFPDAGFNCKSFDISELSKVSSDAVISANHPLSCEEDGACGYVNLNWLNVQNYTTPVTNKFSNQDTVSREYYHSDEFIPNDSSVENDLKGIKETKTTLFLETSNEISAPSALKFSKNAKKHSTFHEAAKHPFRKIQKLSPFKAKSRFVSADKEASVRNSITSSKSVVGAEKNAKLLKLPKKLKLNKSRATEPIVYQRNPFASMNIYYDERWIEKREAAFTAWLNFILTPNDFSSEDIKVDSAKLWIESIKESASIPAPTKEELSLKAFTATRNLNVLRKSSFNLYHSEEIVSVIQKIEREVDLKKINIRKDRAIHADLGIKKSILEMLLSYNTLWLRIGLETIYGEVITLQNNADVLGLSRFIVHRFLQNPELSAKYSHPAVINYYKKGYDEEMKRFTLKKFLLLVFFLDKAKNLHLIRHNPCLFNKSAKYKSSRDLLIVFSREYLSGEGDITKHLRYLGYTVTYHQSALEEFDFSVRNLSTELRCGLRLGRVVEFLLQDWTIFQKLRINTINRLTKIHNNSVVLTSLKNASIEIENNIEPKHITDGDRERTLDLLWQIIFKTQIVKLIDKEFLKKEIAFLHRNLKLKADFAAYNALRKHDFATHKPEVDIPCSTLYKENEILQLLLEWCQAVCAHYDIKVNNFTSSFSDGRVLCLLLHHYHPNILPYEAIQTETSSSYFDKQMEVAESNENSPFYVENGQSHPLMQKLLKNEKDNLTLVFQKFQEVGNIPILSCPSDMSNTIPDEKVVVTLVSYVNMRLMELSIEIRAARKILHAWHCYKLRKQHKKLKVEMKAVVIIQRAFKMYKNRKRMKEETKAAIKIQCFWRMLCAKKQLASLKKQQKMKWLNSNAKIIQAAFRGFLVRKSILEKHQAAIIIQTCYRKWIIRTHFIRLKSLVVKIQQKYRAKIIGQRQRLHYIKLLHNTIKLQAYGRGLLTRRGFKRQHSSAVKIQSFVKMWLMKRRYLKIRNACITIQKNFRGYLLTEFYSQEYQNHRSAAISIQRWYRAMKAQHHKIKCVVKLQSCIRRYLTRKKYLNLLQNIRRIQTWWCASLLERERRDRNAAIKIQSMYRMYSFRKKFLLLKKAAATIEKCRITKIQREKYLKMKQSAIKIQSMFRCFSSRKQYLKTRKSIVLIQAYCRRFIFRNKYLIIRNGFIKLQALYRGRCTRKRIEFLNKNAIIVQSAYRRWKAETDYKSIRQACIIIQKRYRATIEMKKQSSKFNKIRESAVKIQAFVRCHIARIKYLTLKTLAVKMQARFRMIIDYKRYIKMKNAAILIQRYYRSYKEMKIIRRDYLYKISLIILVQSKVRSLIIRRKFLEQKNACIVIQSWFRMYTQRNKYIKLHGAVVFIQRYFRNKEIMKNHRSAFMQKRKVVVYLQSKVRSIIARKRFLIQKNACILIQSALRRYLHQKRYLKIQQAIFCLQNHFRSWRLMKNERYNYLKKRQAAVVLQSVFRSILARKTFMKQKNASIVIQSHFRMYTCRKNFIKYRSAAIAIQMYYRSWKLMKFERNRFSEKRNVIILLQSKFKSVMAVKNFRQQKNACIIIQSYFKMYLQRKNYCKLRNVAIFLQSHYRNLCLTKECRKSFIEKRNVVILLQSKVRCTIERRRFLKQKKACIIIQSFIRMLSQKK